MKTNVIIAKSTERINGVRKNYRAANVEFTSISSVLKFMQQSKFLREGFADVFAACGYDITKGKLEPAGFFALAQPEQWGEDKKGNKYVGIWGTKKDKDGNETEVLRKVSSWSPLKVFKVLAQSAEIAATK